jgi:hypothetical protein
MDIGFWLSVVTAVAGLAAAVTAIVTTATEHRDARNFKAEFEPKVMANGTAAQQLLLSIAAHGTAHELFEQDMRERQQRSQDLLREMARWQQQAVEWSQQLGTRTPQEWEAWARRVAGQDGTA